MLRVGDVATVTAGYEPRRTAARSTASTALFLQIQKTSDASEVDASNNVIAALPKIRAQFPDINFSIINVQSKYTEQQLDSVIRTLVEGIVLTGIVMLFFLGSWRNAIVVLIAIPASLGVAIFVMKMLGLTLDTISLLGMTLVIGILVDDSTVVLENIERHHEMGEPPMPPQLPVEPKSAWPPSSSRSSTSSSSCRLRSFKARSAAIWRSSAIVVVISTLTSLFVCFTITPSLAAIGPSAIGNRGASSAASSAASSNCAAGTRMKRCRGALRHRAFVIGFCLVSFVGAIAIVPLGIVGGG